MSGSILRVTFISNYLLHHQTPFCEEMAKHLGEGFTFVATRRIPDEQLRLGYRDMSHDTDYALNAYESDENMQRAMELALESDIVIRGAAPYKFIEERLKQKKITFRYSERYFKKGYWRLLDPRVLWRFYKEDIRHRKDPYYMLCASAYTARDCRFIHAFPQKTYRWGYFPEVKKYQDIEKIIKGKSPASILWAGRLIGWKHPEATINLAKKLRQTGYKFSLRIIGTGEKEAEIAELIRINSLTDCVKMLGPMSPEEVRKNMEKSEIFIFTSDQNEGWGAVLNESMNSACAVVANQEIGSVPYLIDDGKNGLVYNRKKQDDLFKKVKSILDDKTVRIIMQKNAYQTMLSLWNAEVAADRFLNLANELQHNRKVTYIDGPCSMDL